MEHDRSRAQRERERIRLKRIRLRNEWLQSGVEQYGVYLRVLVRAVADVCVGGGDARAREEDEGISGMFVRATEPSGRYTRMKAGRVA